MTVEYPLAVDFTVVLPELIVTLTALIVIVADLYLPVSQRRWLGWLSLAGLVAAFIDVIAQHDAHKVGFSGSVVLDGFSLFCDGVMLTAGILTLLMSMDYLEREHINLGEYYVLVLGTLSGMMLMTAANSLIVIFLALELFSICLYVLAGFERTLGEVAGGGAQVFPPERLRLGLPAVRHGAGIWGHGIHDAAGYCGVLEDRLARN